MMKKKIFALASAFLAGFGACAPAFAQGDEPYLGQIIWTGFNFCPRGWTPANGALLPISQYTALFSLLGTTYGGNGQSTFALPDLRGRVTLGPGQGPGLPNHVLGEQAGAESTTLLESQMPQHTHSASGGVVARASSGAGNTTAPGGNVLASGGTTRAYAPGPADVDMAADSVSAQTTLGVAGGSQPFNNVQPVLTMTACIALEGVYPPRP